MFFFLAPKNGSLRFYMVSPGRCQNDVESAFSSHLSITDEVLGEPVNQSEQASMPSTAIERRRITHLSKKKDEVTLDDPSDQLEQDNTEVAITAFKIEPIGFS